MAKIFPIRITKKVTAGGGNVPAGAAVMTDALPYVGVKMGDTNGPQTDALSASAKANLADTNGPQTDAIAKVSISGLTDVIGMQSEALSALIKLRTAGAGTFVAPITGTYTFRIWGGGQGGAAGSTTNGGTGGTSGDYVSVSLFLNKNDSVPYNIAAASAAAGAGPNTTVTPPGAGGTQYQITAKTFTYNAAPGGTIGPSAATARLIGATTPPTFALATSNNSSSVVTVPSGVQDGDKLVIVFSPSSAGTTDPRIVVVGTSSGPGSPITIGYVSLTAADAGLQITVQRNGSGGSALTTFPAAAVYRNVSSISYIGANSSAAGSATVIAPGFVGGQTDLAVMGTTLAQIAGVTPASDVSPPSGVTERGQFTNSVGQNGEITSINDAPLTAFSSGGIVSKGGGNATASTLGGYTGTITPGNAGAAGALLAAGGKGGDAPGPGGGPGGAGNTGAGSPGTQPGGGGGGGGGSLILPGAASPGGAGGIDILVQLA